MLRYILRRFSFGILAVIGATIIVFALSRMSGDPRYLFVGQAGYGISQEQWDEWGRQMGLDKPVIVQYGVWLWRVMRGDFGNSISTQKAVIKLIAERWSNTAQLALGAWIFGSIVGLPLGVFSATHRGGVLDYIARTFALLGQSLPIFWTGMMFILVFAVHLGWFPAGGKGEGLPIRHLILPSIALGWLPAASYLRLTRSSMLEILDSEYVKFARAKGVRESIVIWKHAFKNASLVPITFSALMLIGFITGTVVCETVFTWPGLGRLAVASIWDNDFPTLSALVLILAALYVVVVLVVDILYGVLDPRIRYD